MTKKTKKGRKTVMTKVVLGKLEEAFAMGCSDREACLYANINPDTLYSYQQKKPEFSERKKLLKKTPVLKARQTILDSLDDPKVAMWFLERQAKEEFNLNYIKAEPRIDPELTAEERAELARVLEMEGYSVTGLKEL